MGKKIKKILLISPPGKITVTKEGSRERKMAVPPLGLAYLAANLMTNGFEVEILDTLIEGYNNEQQNQSVILYGLNKKEIGERIGKINPDLIGVSCLFSNRGNEALDICRIAKETIQDVPIVLGGQHPSGMPELIRDKNVDYILRGESDESLVQLVRTINESKNLSGIDGIVLKERGNLIPKNSYPDVRKLPLPAWDLINLEKYWDIGVSDYEVNKNEQKKFMVMITSRGCPHNCSFCTATLMSGRKYREREIESVVSEIGLYKQKYGVREIHFWDDNFFVNKKKIKVLLSHLIKEFSDIEFQTPSGSEINCIDEEVIELLSKANFKKVCLAVESLNEDIQDKFIDKKVKLDRIPHIIKKIKNAGMIAHGSFMVGFPGETKQQLDYKLMKAKEYDFDRISISIVNPLPGTLLYEQCEREGLFYEDFEPNNIRWSNENIRMEEVERDYISKMRRKVWESFMDSKINIQLYEREGVYDNPDNE